MAEKYDKSFKKRDKTRGLVEGLNPGINQFGYEKYTQDSEEHQKGFIIALNNQFPNLVGFGVYQYLKQLWALNPRAKIEWTDENIKKLSLQMNIEESLLRDVVAFCRSHLKIFFLSRSVFELKKMELKYLIYPNFMQELIDLEVRRMAKEAYIEVNKIKDGSDKNEKDIKNEIISKLREFLVLTEDMESFVDAHYPLLGKPKDLWDNFIYDVEKNYLKWESILLPENYEKVFYLFLNNIKPSDMEYLSRKI